MDWKALGSQVARIGLPLLGGAVGGPGGALIGQALAAALGLANDSTPEQIAAGLGNLSGEQLVKLRELEVSLVRAEIDSDSKRDAGQVEINKLNAASEHFFDRGWRPAVGWLCVGAFAYMVALRPILPWVLTVAGASAPALPPIDTGEIAAILLGMLGLGGMRTAEKIKKARR